MLKRFPQLQSGYISSAETMLVKPEKVPPTAVGSLIMAVPTSRTQDEFFYSPQIDALVNEALHDPLKLRTLAFQSKLLETVGKVFEKQSFVSFVRLQEDNQHMSTGHVLFLEETIRVALGMLQQRSTSLQTWASLLSTANPSNGDFRSSTFFKNFQYSPFLNMSLSEFITSWIRHAGYSDLLITLQVLFGRRTLHASYGAKF